MRARRRDGGQVCALTYSAPPMPCPKRLNNRAPSFTASIEGCLCPPPQHCARDGAFGRDMPRISRCGACHGKHGLVPADGGSANRHQARHHLCSKLVCGLKLVLVRNRFGQGSGCRYCTHSRNTGFSRKACLNDCEMHAQGEAQNAGNAKGCLGRKRVICENLCKIYTYTDVDVHLHAHTQKHIRTWTGSFSIWPCWFHGGDEAIGSQALAVLLSILLGACNDHCQSIEVRLLREMAVTVTVC